MEIKTIQQSFLDDIVADQQNPNQQLIDWLMKEHLKTQASLESIYDSEISKQRMVLEEKLARRKALAQKMVSFGLIENVCSWEAINNCHPVIFLICLWF
jgi:ATP-dependent protease ClpP protease subunit